MTNDLVPDKIYFFISEEPHNIDEGIKPHEIPDLDNPIVEFIYTPNIGSLRKIVPIMKMYWNRPNTKIIACDDDRRIIPDIIEKLVDFSDANPLCACATAGNIYTREGLDDSQKREILLGWHQKKPIQVDLLNSGMQMLVKPSHFPEDILHWEQYKEVYGVNLTEENFLSYLLAKKGTPRFVVPITRCPMQLPVKEELYKSKFVEKYKCLQAHDFHEKMGEWKCTNTTI